MVNMLGVDELMKKDKVNLPSVRVFICNRPWDCLTKPLCVLCIPSLYLYWAILILYFHTFRPKYNFVSVNAKLHTDFTTNRIFHLFNLYASNSTDPRLTSLFREVFLLTKQQGLPIPLTDSFTVSPMFSFPRSFSLLVKWRVVLVFTSPLGSSFSELFPSLLSLSFNLISLMVRIYFFHWLTNFQSLYLGSDYSPPA